MQGTDFRSAVNSCSCSATSHSTSLLSFPCNTWCAHTTQEVSSRQGWSSGMDGPLRDWLWSMAVPPVSAVPGICLVFLPTGAVNMKTMTYLGAVGQSLTHVQLFATPAHQVSLPFTISQSLLKLMSTEAVMPSNHLILCCPLLLLPSIFPSIKVFPVSQLFTSDGQSIGASSWVLPMNIQGWFPLGLTSLISLQTRDSQESYQHHNSKESILQHSAFFMVALHQQHLSEIKSGVGSLHQQVTFSTWTAWILFFLLVAFLFSKLYFRILMFH